MQNKTIIDLFVDFIQDKPNWHLHLNVDDEVQQFDITLASPTLDVTLDLVENSVYIYYHSKQPEMTENVVQECMNKNKELFKIISMYMLNVGMKSFSCFYSSIYMNGEKEFVVTVKQ